MSRTLIEAADAFAEKGAWPRAFYDLALEAIRQLVRIADANEKISARLDKWDDGNGALDVMTHKPGNFSASVPHAA